MSRPPEPEPDTPHPVPPVEPTEPPVEEPKRPPPMTALARLRRVALLH